MGLRFLLACAGLLFVSMLSAASFDRLYQVEVPVGGQDTEARNTAISQAFQIVLTRITGDRKLLGRPAMRTQMNKASAFVQQYRYRIDNQAVLAEGDAGETGSQQRLLQVTFDKQAVDRMLREKGLPIWGHIRPQVLVWVGMEKNRNRRLLIPDTSPKLIHVLKSTANERGIPFLIPLMDFEDQSALSASDLWGSFEKPIRQASSRYGADVVLTLRLKAVGEGFWRTEWILYENDQPQKNWNFDGQSLFRILRQGMNEMADLLAERYAPSGGLDTESLMLQVSGVRQFDDLIRIENFLDTQDAVEHYEVRYVEKDRVLLDLGLRGGAQAFVQSLQLSDLLVPDEGESPSGDEDALIDPELQPQLFYYLR